MELFEIKKINNSFIIKITIVLFLIVGLWFLVSNGDRKPSNVYTQTLPIFENQKYVVAVLDTGVDFNRLVLKNNKLAGYCFSEKRDNIQSLCETSQFGENCPLSLDKDCGHGTFVAGILAKAQPEVQIVSYQVYSTQDKTLILTHKNYLDALDQIILQKKEKIINYQAVNLSWNFDEFYIGSCNDYKPEFTSKVAELNKLGVKIYASTGNNSKLNQLAYPACVTGVIAVGSKNRDETIAKISNYTPKVSQFGLVSIFSVYPSSDTEIENTGTSFSVPQVIALDLNK